MPKWIPKVCPKIDLWVIRASIFEDLGDFGRMLIFDAFWDVQKINEKGYLRVDPKQSFYTILRMILVC